MKFIYILFRLTEVVEVLKIDSERYFLLKELVDADLKSIGKVNEPIPVSFNASRVKGKLQDLLFERSTKPLDVPDYEGRFKEDEIFVEMKVFGENLKLCNTGFDNKVIFLVNLYDSIKKNDEPYYLFFSNNHKEFLDWKQKEM